uniref:Uncharacterized protein n=1 Tax=Arundo donax TaxID=35708 RepID=A0A0A9FI88_ARUDO
MISYFLDMGIQLVLKYEECIVMINCRFGLAPDEGHQETKLIFFIPILSLFDFAPRLTCFGLIG